MRDLPAGTVTFVFTDVEGSTRLLEKLGERYVQALADHRRVVREAVTRHGGVEVDTQGDALFVAFARVSDAVAAAEAAQAELEIPVRMGIHTGEPQLVEDGYVGLDVHRAARICAAAHGGQVLLSQATRDLVAADATDLGLHRLKDVGELRLYQLGPGTFPPLRSLNQTNLPLGAEPLLGRKKERADVLRLLRLDGARLVTVTGPGGIGKTAFAVEVASELVEDFGDGVWFVDLSALRDPELVLPTIASTVGARGELAEQLAERQVLLVLDNVEQVVEAAPQLAALLEHAPDLRVIATSREPLRLGLERTYPLQALAESPAVELFRRHAEAVDPSFDAPYDQLAALCSRLDNLPLALELAAARTRALTLAQLLERLDDRLPLLSGRRRDLPERQRTLRATIDWSHDLLEQDEQQLFHRLSVFADGFDLAAAEQVVGADLDTLESLVEKNLVRRAAGRLGMLETLREFAEQKLDAGELEDLTSKHTAYYSSVADAVTESDSDPYRSTSDREQLDHLELHLANFRKALSASIDSGDRASAIRLCFALRRLWLRRGGVREGRLLIDKALAATGDADDRLLAKGLFTLGSLAWVRDDYEVAERAFLEVIDIAAKLDDSGLAAASQVGLAAVARGRGDLSRAAELLERTLAYRRAGTDRDALRRVLHHLAEVERDRGSLDRARELLEEAIAITRVLGADASRAAATHSLGDVALDERRFEEAAAHYRHALTMAVDVVLPVVVVACLFGLAATAAGRGDARRSGVFWAAAERVMNENDLRVIAFERDRYEELVARLPNQDFVDAVEDGRARGLSFALSLALEGEAGEERDSTP